MNITLGVFGANFEDPVTDILYSGYSVFKKEGNKVNAYYTPKNGIFESTLRFILTTTSGHLMIYINDLKYVT